MKKTLILASLLVGSIAFAQEVSNEQISKDLKSYKENYTKAIEAVEFAAKNGSISQDEKKYILAQLEKSKTESMVELVTSNITYAQWFEDWDTMEAAEAVEVIIEDDDDVDFSKIVKDKNPLKDVKKLSTKFRPIFGFGFGKFDGLIPNSAFEDVKNMNWEWGFMATSPLDKKNNVSLSYGITFNYNVSHLKKGHQFNVNNAKQLEILPNTANTNAKLRNTYLTLPVQMNFNFGKDKDTGFKVGIGGYAGVNINSKQIFRYEENGYSVKSKYRGDYQANTFQYGLQASVGYKSTSLVFKYDLDETFKNQSPSFWTIGLRLGL